MALVYQKYQEYVNDNGFEDQSSVLSYLPELIESNDEYKYYAFYIGIENLFTEL